MLTVRRKQALEGLGAPDDRLRFSLVTVANRAPTQQEPERIVGAAGQPAFGAGWAALAAAGRPRFWRTDNLWIHLAGQVSAGASGSIIFTLPAGYRPPFEQYQEVFAMGGYGVLQVISAGRFGEGGLLYTGAFLPGAYMSLDGISFRAT